MNNKTLPQQNGVLKARTHKKVGVPLILNFRFQISNLRNKQSLICSFDLAARPTSASLKVHL